MSAKKTKNALKRWADKDEEEAKRMTTVPPGGGKSWDTGNDATIIAHRAGHMPKWHIQHSYGQQKFSAVWTATGKHTLNTFNIFLYED